MADALQSDGVFSFLLPAGNESVETDSGSGDEHVPRPVFTDFASHANITWLPKLPYNILNNNINHHNYNNNIINTTTTNNSSSNNISIISYHLEYSEINTSDIYALENLSSTAGAVGDDTGVTHTFSDIMGIWITGSVCLLGFIGNVISFIVLLQAFKRSPMFYVLRAVAVSDAVFLFSVFVIQTLVNMYPYTGMFYWCYMYRGYIQYGTWPVLMITQMSTVWLTVLVSAERYVAICYPLKAASFCTIPKVRRSALTVFFLSVVYNIPRFFEYEIVTNMNMDKTAVGAHEVYRYLYSCILYSLLLFFIPLALLVILNAKLIWSLESGRRQWQRLSCNQKREQMITIIPLCIVIVFFVCGTPALVVNIVDSIYPDIYGYYPHFVTFMVVANLLVVLNSACNFIIYCLLGKKFRAKLLDLCRCRVGGRYRAVHHLVSTQYTDGQTDARPEGNTEM